MGPSARCHHTLKSKLAIFVKLARVKVLPETSLQSKFKDMTVGEMVLRHQSPYDEMIGLSEEKSDNTLEVLIGGEAYALQPGDADRLN